MKTSIFIGFFIITLRTLSAAELQISPDAEKPYPGLPSRFGAQTFVTLARGETRGFWLKLQANSPAQVVADATSTPSGLKSEIFYAPPIVTKLPSYEGAPVGEHLDPLLKHNAPVRPRIGGKPNYFFVDLSAPANLAPGNYKLQIRARESAASRSNSVVILSVKVSNFKMPSVPSLPLYIQAINSFEIDGHFNRKYPSEQNPEAMLNDLYQTALLKHRIQPISSYISYWSPDSRTGSVDLDAGGILSFKNQVMKYARDPRLQIPLLNDLNVKPSLFKSLERTVINARLTHRAWVYVYDEPNSPQALNGVRAKLESLYTNAPSIKRMVTTVPERSIHKFVDIYAPVMDWWDTAGRPPISAYAGKEVWLYTSCMAHGCGPAQGPSAPGRSSGVPDLVIDRPSVNPRAFVWMAWRYHQNVSGLFYYNSVENYRYADPWINNWSFGGNGDGTLFYPVSPMGSGLGKGPHQAVTSARLKMLREALFDYEYLKSANANISNLVTNTRTWKRDYGSYQRLRDSIAEKARN